MKYALIVITMLFTLAGLLPASMLIAIEENSPEYSVEGTYIADERALKEFKEYVEKRGMNYIVSPSDKIIISKQDEEKIRLEVENKVALNNLLTESRNISSHLNVIKYTLFVFFISFTAFVFVFYISLIGRKK